MNSLIESTAFLTAAVASFCAAFGLTWLMLAGLFRLLPGRAVPAGPAVPPRPRIVHRRAAPAVRSRVLRVIAGGKV